MCRFSLPCHIILLFFVIPDYLIRVLDPVFTGCGFLSFQDTCNLRLVTNVAEVVCKSNVVFAIIPVPNNDSIQYNCCVGW